MTTYTWTGLNNVYTDVALWNPGTVPGPGDTMIIPANATIDFVVSGGTADLTNNIIDVAGTGDVVNFTTVDSSGLTLTSGDGAAFGDFVWNITDSSLDTSSITLGNFAELNFTGSTSTSMQITSNGTGNTGTVIQQSGSGDQLQINATGTVNTSANLFLTSGGGTASINVMQDGTNGGFYLSTSALVDAGEALTISGDTNTGTRFSNQGFFVVAGIGAAGSATLDARMNSIAGFIDILGASDGATLDDATNMPGAQFVSFGDASGVLQIEADKTLSSAFSVVTGGSTVATTVLDNFFSRITGFKPGDSIELLGVNPSTLSLRWSFGNDPNYGNDVLTISNGGTEIARLRFVGEQWVDGTGTFDGANSTNFTFSNDGSGDTVITLGNTVAVDGSIAVTGTVAQWGGVTNGATVDWSTGTMWMGGTGAGGLPGQYQTAQISLTQAQGEGAITGTFEPYVLTITTAETVGAIVMDDPLATLAISAPLTLSRIPGQTDGSGFVNDSGEVDIQNGGTVSTLRFVTDSDLSLEPGALLSIAGNVPFTAGSGLAGLDVEKNAQVTGAVISSSGNISVGANGNGNMVAENNIVGQTDTSTQYGTIGSTVFDTYTQVGGNAALTGADTGAASLQISGPNTDWFDTNADASTPLDGAMIVGGGAPSLNALDQVEINSGGDGMVEISDGALVVEAAFAMLGATKTSQGDVNVDGATWLVGTGDVATPGSIVFGNSIVGTSTLFSSNLPQLVVGSGGTGTLNVNSGTVVVGGVGAFNTDRMRIGNGNTGNNTATGMVNVQGTGALLNTNGPLDVSLRSNGTLNVSNGATVEVASDTATADIEYGLIIGNQNGTVGPNTGMVNVTLGLLTDNGDLVIGRNAQGFMNVGNGGSVAVSGALIMGGLIALNNGTVATAPTLLKGSSSGTLNINGNGIVTVAGNPTLDLFQGGTTTPTPSTIDLNGSAELLIGGGVTPAAGELTVATGATLQGAGDVSVNSDDSTLRNFGTVLAGGLTSGGVAVQDGATLTLNAVLAGPGVFALAQGATMLLANGSFTDTANFDFGTENLVSPAPLNERIRVTGPVSNFQGTVSDFYTSSNGIDFVGAGFVTNEVGYTPDSNPAAGGTVSVVTAGGTATFSVIGPHPLGFTASEDGAGTGTVVFANDLAPCFAAGTRILTAGGEVTVEALRVGELVPSRGGALRRVRWIGRARVSVDDATAPVMVRADAFAAGAPHRALVLSPDHAVLAGGALVPVRYLANGTSIARARTRGTVEYFHVELDRHDVLFAEGLAAESYLDTGNRAAFASEKGEGSLDPHQRQSLWNPLLQRSEQQRHAPAAQTAKSVRF